MTRDRRPRPAAFIEDREMARHRHQVPSVRAVVKRLDVADERIQTQTTFPGQRGRARDADILKIESRHRAASRGPVARVETTVGGKLYRKRLRSGGMRSAFAECSLLRSRATAQTTS